MEIQPKIQETKEKLLVGINIQMSLLDNKTGELWQNFMPRRKEISGTTSKDLFSLQVYESNHFTNFDPSKKFEKWALIEVSDFSQIPDGMKSFVLPKGLYAVFHYKGLNTNNEIFQYIFGRWLPNSQYELDERPHFEVLGEKYKNNDPDSEEEIWIPGLKLKSTNAH